jgi:hypothetical protein
MGTRGNLPQDFPADQFAIVAFCAACGRSAVLERARIPAGLTVQALPARLRCRACGSRDASIRIIYTGAGGFQYGYRRDLPWAHCPESP